MAFSNLKKVSISPPFGSASYTVQRDSLVFPYVVFSDASLNTTSARIIWRKSGVNTFPSSIWGNMRVNDSPFTSLTWLEPVSYAFVPNNAIITFLLAGVQSIDLYIIELDTDVGNV